MREEIETSIGTELAPEEKTDSFTIKFHAEEGTRLSMGDEVEAWDQRLLRLRRRTQLGIGTANSGANPTPSAVAGLSGAASTGSAFR